MRVEKYRTYWRCLGITPSRTPHCSVSSVSAVEVKTILKLSNEFRIQNWKKISDTILNLESRPFYYFWRKRLYWYYCVWIKLTPKKKNRFESDMVRMGDPMGYWREAREAGHSANFYTNNPLELVILIVEGCYYKNIINTHIHTIYTAFVCKSSELIYWYKNLLIPFVYSLSF